MPRETIVSIWCKRIIEAGWLLALSLIPIYFNLMSARHFEPDKATTLRALVLIMAAAALIHALERMNIASESGSDGKPGSTGARARAPDKQPADVPTSSNPFAGLWQRLNSVPLLVPTLFYALVFLIATIASVVPHTSFWGSYQRLQGTYTNLSYIALFLIMVAHLRQREQLERIVIISLLTGLAVAGYGIVQHLQLDPLPWKGDVITRVASTMGNSIFVAAYLIMIVPLGLYRLIATAHDARHAPPSSDRAMDGMRAFAVVLLVAGTLALLLGVIKFSAAVATGDLRYWWVFPGAIIVATALWSLLSRRIDAGEQGRDVPLWPGLLFGGYLLFFVLMFAASRGAHVPAAPDDPRIEHAADWWLWMLSSFVLVAAFYTMTLILPRPTGASSRLSLWLQAGGSAFVVAAMLVAIIFTQSRGPWIGIGSGLFVFLVLLLIQAIRRARLQERAAQVKWLRAALGGLIALTLAVGGFLIAFNVSDAPVFEPLRDVPYLGRMGTLLEVESGTGKVRVLIWGGDEHAGGAVGLITSEPLRTLIGWGPESMFVAYNQFYPPSLAQIESRGASPDRSHQAVLDELITKGFLGLTSYFFLLISFFVLCWRLIRSSDEWRWQVFFIACFAIIVAHVMEGMTGIPVVSTLTMFWVTLAMMVAGGMLAGHYVIGKVPAPAADTPPTEEAPAEPVPQRPRKGTARGGRRGAAARGAATSRASSKASGTGPAALALYAVLLVVMLFAVWWFNLSTVYADMRFQEGQLYSQQRSAQAQVAAMQRYITTINSNPREDFYYLNLGRTLMTLAEQLRSQGMPIGNENPNADVADLLSLNNRNAVVTFVNRSTPLELLSYAQAVLLQARDLNPRNKDHYANLARLNDFWYNWTQDPQKLQASHEWYSRANEVAPQDVTLLNEHAGSLMTRAAYASRHNNSEAAQTYISQAMDLLNRSRELDPRYADTMVRMAEIHRTQGRLEEATDLYVQAIRKAPATVRAVLSNVLDSMANRPDLLIQLSNAFAERAERRDSAQWYALAGMLAARADDPEQAAELYARSTEIAPDNLINRLNYTIVLSNAQQYDQALSEAQTGLALAQSQEGGESEAARFRQLVQILEQY
jgi:tetratricopeptide (TPR) repeat protein